MFVSYDEETTFSLKKKFKWETNEPHLQYFKSLSTITLIYTKFIFYFIIQNYYYFCILASYFLKHLCIVMSTNRFWSSFCSTWTWPDNFEYWRGRPTTDQSKRCFTIIGFSFANPIYEKFHWHFPFPSKVYALHFFLFILKGKLSFWSLIFDACVKNQNSCQRFKYDSLVFNLLVLCPNNC